MNFDNIEPKCSVKSCKEPIWQQNSLLYFECEHPQCRNCVLKLFLGEDWTKIECNLCGKKDEVQLKKIMKNLDAQISVSQMTHPPKEKIQDSSLVCSVHENQGIIFHCERCNLYGCFSCIENHTDHYQRNVSQINEKQVLSKLK